jgi:hypothetical protein
MKKTLLFATLALVLAFGAFNQPALAGEPQHGAKIIGPAGLAQSSAVPNATPTALSGMTAMTAINAAWPAFCDEPGTTCDASDPAGSMLVGEPTEVWSLATCTAVASTSPCGEVYNAVISNTATGDWKLELEVKQGSSVIYDSGLINEKETFPAGDIGLSYFEVAFGPGNCPSTVTCVAPVAGTATIEYINELGTTKVTGTATITLQ